MSFLRKISDSRGRVKCQENRGFCISRPLVIGIISACIMFPQAAIAEKIARHVEMNKSFKVDLQGLMVSDNNQFEVNTRPLHGNAYIDALDGKTMLSYHPENGFQGFDKVVVSALKGNKRVETSLYLTVGEPFFSKTDVFYEKVAEQLFALVVVAIFLEVALSALFRNRVFEKLDLVPGIKTIVSLVVSLLIVFSFNFNIFLEVMYALQKGATPGGTGPKLVSGVITALLLAGGSSTVFFLYTKLGLRNPFKSEKDVPGLTGLGAVKVKVVRGGNIVDTEPVAIELNNKLVAVLAGGQTIFGDDKGYQLEAGVYTVRIKANDKTNQPAEVSRLVAIEPGKPLEIELAFA